MNRRRSCGLIGFQNAGKRTLQGVFQRASEAWDKSSLSTAAKTTAKLPVPDTRLEALSNFCKSTKKVPIEIEMRHWPSKITESADFCPKFLEEMRTVSTLLHVVRCYGSNAPSPSDEIDKMNAKIIACDLDLVQKRLSRVSTGRKIEQNDVSALQRIAEWLDAGKSARLLPPTDELRKNIRISELQLLSLKPMVYVLNVDEKVLNQSQTPALNELNSSFDDELVERAGVFVCSAAVEEEIGSLAPSERASFMDTYGLTSTCHERLPSMVYKEMPVQTFFTTGDTMTHAWSIPKGSSAIDASAQIHSSFRKDFVSAKTLAWKDYVTHTSISEAESAMKKVGSEYIMKDGDVMVVTLDKRGKNDR